MENKCPICGGTGTAVNGEEVYCICCGAVLKIKK